MQRPHIATLFCAAFVIMLTSCATPSEMRARSPASAYASSLDAKSVAVCVAGKWEDLSTTLSVNMRPTKTGYTVSFTNTAIGQTQLLADVDDTPSGSTTRYFKHLVLGEGSFDAAVASCQRPG